MGGDEVLRAGTEAVAFGCFRDRSCPSLRERSVELLRAAVDFAGALGSAQEPSSSLFGTVTSMEHPGDAQMFQMADAAGEPRPGLPRVGQLFVRHQGERVPGEPHWR